MAESIESEGATVEEATEAALATLGAGREDVDVEVLANPSRGLFGLGGRVARVRVTRKGAATAPAPVSARANATPARSSQDRTGVVQHARTFLEDLLRRMGFEGTVTLQNDGENPLLEIHSESSSVLIGKHGQTLDALEYLVNRVACREEEGAVRINLDCEHYRVKRQRSLEEMAAKMADQAKRLRRSVTLNPLSPRDRRIVHLALQGDSALTTRSTGEGFYRRLVIIPNNERRRGDRPQRR